MSWDKRGLLRIGSISVTQSRRILDQTLVRSAKRALLCQEDILVIFNTSIKGPDDVYV